MGKGDKKSKRGKITLGTYGVRRLRKKNVKAILSSSKAMKAKDEIIKTIEIEEVVVQPVEKVVLTEVVEAVVEPKVVKEKLSVKAAKPAKEKKEVKAEKPVKTEKQAKEPKVKKEKKAE